MPSPTPRPRSRNTRSITAQLQALTAEHASLSTAESAREQELDLLRHQVAEIDAAKLDAAEEEQIESRYKLASNSKRLIELASGVAGRLSEADDSVLDAIGRDPAAPARAGKARSRDGANSPPATTPPWWSYRKSRARSPHYVERLDLDPQQLAALEQRVSLFETLKRKYGGSIAEVIAFGERAAERMQKIEGRDAELERLAQAIEAARARNDASRHRAAQTARQSRAQTLRNGAQQSARPRFPPIGIRSAAHRIAEPRANGTDTLELLFSPNPGEPLKPLRAIASSGEISRLMLAIKSSLAAQDAIPLLVFDEIDANVGGEIANAVGAKMRALAGRASGALHHAFAAGRGRPRPRTSSSRKKSRKAGRTPSCAK